MLIIEDFTDPTCPFAYSLEPVKLKLKWQYRDNIQWRNRMIVMSETIDPNSKLTPEMLAKNRTKLRESHGMPMDDTPTTRLAPSVNSCRAYIAVQLNQPESADLFLRNMRIAAMSSQLLDDLDLLHTIAEDSGITISDLEQWMKVEETEKVMRSDMDAARSPGKAALTLSHKLGRTTDGGQRYSAGSYIFKQAEQTVFELPGFWPYVVYDAVLANLLPDIKQYEKPHSIEELIQWADMPLATAEVAHVMGITMPEANNKLTKVAHKKTLGQDGFWYLA
jgi:predicted DsbA family dithiol-disulfide isomerase